MTHMVPIKVVTGDSFLLHGIFVRMDNATLASFYRGTKKEQRCLTDEHMQIGLATPLLDEHLQGKLPQFLVVLQCCAVPCDDSETNS